MGFRATPPPRKAIFFPPGTTAIGKGLHITPSIK